MVMRLTLIGILLPPTFAVAQKSAAPSPGPMALQVRSEFLYAWNAYKQYAWGHDELKPLSKGYHDWYSKSLLMTPVDALDTMIIMGLTDEADKTREFIATNLSFDQDIEVKNFEITIRLLGGLLSSYQMTGDQTPAGPGRQSGEPSAARLQLAHRHALHVRKS